MKTAFYGHGTTPYTVENYVDREGPKLDKYGKKRIRPSMHCYACGWEVHSVGETGPLREALWAHNSAPEAPWCPLKCEGGTKYEVLEPRVRNPGQVTELRTNFLARWRTHWGYIQQIAPMADIHTFEGFIRHADSTHWWGHVGLEEWHIPYIFLATCEFPPPSRPKARAVRATWLRFRFTARVRSLEDLWIRTTGKWGFMRLSYRQPRRGEPKPEHLVDVVPIVPNPCLLEDSYPPPYPYQSDAMHKRFGL